MIRDVIPDPDLDFSPIPDTGVKKAPDSGPEKNTAYNIITDRTRLLNKIPINTVKIALTI
jgi:hypothetical protein